MTIGEELQRNFGKKINRTGEVFKALVANSKKTGAMETILNDVNSFCKEYYGTPDIYQQTGELLAKTVLFYTFLERFGDETEEALKKRIAAIFVRNGDTVWGTPYDILNVFRQYFPSAQIYLVENVNSTEKENLIKNGDFQDDSNFWILSNPEIRSPLARFTKSFGLKLTDGEYASQEIELPNKDISYEVMSGDTYISLAINNYGNEYLADYIKTYADNPEILTPGVIIKIPSYNVFFLHFFLKGKCRISIKSNTNMYWNQISESWQSEEVFIEFDTFIKNKIARNIDEKWDDKSIYFMCKNDITSITVTFGGTESQGYVDYIRLFQKFKHPSFSIIAQFEGNSDSEALALGDDIWDPEVEYHEEGDKKVIDGPRAFNNFGYYDDTYLTGVASGYAQDLYEDLIQYVKAQGVKAYIEIVNRDSMIEE